MSDLARMFESFMRQSQEMAEKMGAEFTRAQAAWLEQMKEIMPEGVAEAMGEAMGPGLDAKSHALLTVAGLTARGAGDREALVAAIRAARAAGASPREVSEAIMQMGTIGAFDGVTKAMTIAMSVLGTEGETR